MDKLYLAIDEPHYDGMASQLHRQVMLWAYCNLNEFNFVYVPFKKIGHNCNPTDAENFFNFGHGELRQCDLGDTKINYCYRPEFKSKISFYEIFSNLNYFDEFSNRFWNKIEKTKKPKIIYDQNYINVAVHVRRGDVLDSHKHFAPRFISDEYYIDKMYKLKQKNKNIRFYIFSENQTNLAIKRLPNIFKNCDIFAKFKKIRDLDIQLIIDGCPYFSLWHMFNSDILIGSKGCFSSIPALFHKGDVILPKHNTLAKKNNISYNQDIIRNLNFNYYENEIYRI